MNNKKYILIIILIALFLGGGFFTYQYFIGKNNEILYKVKFTYDNSFRNDPDTYVPNYIASILNIDPPEDGLPIFYNVNVDNPYSGNEGYQTKNPQRFNAEYYIILNKSINTNVAYKKDGLTLNIQKAKQNLLPFLKDPQYCENDDDCTIRMVGCSEGSFNNFNPYHDIYGCESVIYPQENQEELEKICDRTKEFVAVKYFGGSKCIDNKCSAKDKEISCLEGVLP